MMGVSQIDDLITQDGIFGQNRVVIQIDLKLRLARKFLKVALENIKHNFLLFDATAIYATVKLATFMTNFNELSFAGILAKLVGIGSRIFDIERKEKDVGDSLREDFNGFLGEYLILAVQHVAS